MKIYKLNSDISNDWKYSVWLAADDMRFRKIIVWVKETFWQPGLFIDEQPVIWGDVHNFYFKHYRDVSMFLLKWN